MFSGTTTTNTAKLPTTIFILLLACTNLSSQTLSLQPDSEDLSAYAKNKAGQMLAQRFTCFDQGHDHSQYYITLCGDIPDNSKPAKVCYKKEPGHVFIILTMQDTVCHTKDISTAFGFYPQRPASSVIFKNVRCEILDNSSRNYDVLIQKDLTAFEFELILEKAISLTQKNYNLNRYNCYNYALEVFNSVSGIEKIPESRIRFPFIAGKGGSPCCLYRDLEKLKQEGSVWASHISFGSFKAPGSCSN